MTNNSSEQIEKAAEILAKWIGYNWDGLRDGRIGDRGFPQWSFNGIGQKQFQGGKQDLKDIVEQIATLVNGG